MGQFVRLISHLGGRVNSGHFHLAAPGSLVVQTRFQSNATTSPWASSQPAKVYDRNISLRYCKSPLSTATTLNSPANSDIALPNETSKGRRLAVFLAWMLAKDLHLEKYRTLYFKRGFDVLTIKTNPLELLLPPMGSQRIAQNVVDFLKSQISTYPNIVVHGFSVGAYQFGEVLVKLQKGINSREIDASSEFVSKSIKGMIFDSGADIEGIPFGLSRAVFSAPPIAKAMEQMIKFHMRLFNSVATRHYRAASRAFHFTHLRCPALLLVSHDDKLGNPQANEKVANNWRNLGIPVTFKCWDHSRHVSHLHKYPEEYESEIDKFLHRINLGPQLQLDRTESVGGGN